MKLSQAIESLSQKFTSGNTIKVEQATITREEWEVMKRALGLSKLLAELLSMAGDQSVVAAFLAERVAQNNDPEIFTKLAQASAFLAEIR